MKKILILFITSFFSIASFAQGLVVEGFESGGLHPLMSFSSVGSFSSAPGIKANNSFGSNNVFGFGKSACSSSCFDNYKTTLTITFPAPTYVYSIKWKEMEIYGNWGSQGQVFLDGVALSTVALGAQPVNSGSADASPRLINISINQTVTSITFVVNDITSASEIIIDDLEILTANLISGYEYWFDNDFAGKTITTVSPTQQLTVNQLVSTSGLASGIHTFNFRSFDNNGVYSSVASSFFYKTSAISTNPNPQVTAYQYWLDNDYANAVTVSTPNQQQVNINSLISMASVANGIHTFNIRFKDNLNLWSSVASSFFYKSQQQTVIQNQVVGYRYWFDNDFANAIYTPVATNQQVNVMENLDMTQISKGMHQIHFQFKDTLQQWSVVVADSIKKISLPIADFAYTLQINCDSTTVQFTDLSIDGDKYLWNFGDGTTDTTANPTHNYYTPGSYLVSLTATDTLTLASSAYQTSIFVTGNTAHSFAVTSCDSYTSPSGNYTFTTSGTYHDTIPNQWGCDSLLTINATINHTPDNGVTQNGITLTANAGGVTYQWLNCDNGFTPLANETNQSFIATTNGNYAVRISQNNCAGTSICYSVTTVGILESTFINDITVYPNPTDGNVKIDLGEICSEFNVNIIDISGK